MDIYPTCMLVSTACLSAGKEIEGIAEKVGLSGTG
jgi:hypothetical protein